MSRIARQAAAALLAAFVCVGAAPDPSDRLPNPAEEARARSLFQQLRCVVCQNESIDDSQADLAGDLRRIVRGQIAEGRTDGQVRAFLVQRYGEFILLDPTFSPGNAALWLTPVALLAAGGVYLWFQAKRPLVADLILSDEEERALERFATAKLDTVPPHNGPTNAVRGDGITH